MFDFGWIEVLVILLVMLCVLGPQDMLITAYKLGEWGGRLRRYFVVVENEVRETVRDLQMSPEKNVKDVSSSESSSQGLKGFQDANEPSKD